MMFLGYGCAPVRAIVHVDSATDTISSGSCVNLWYAHFDPIGQPTDQSCVAGSITFDGQILGILTNADSIDDTHDLFGSLATIYGSGSAWDSPPGGPIGVSDSVQGSLDSVPVTLDGAAGAGVDAIRIITRFPNPPLSSSPSPRCFCW